MICFDDYYVNGEGNIIDSMNSIGYWENVTVAIAWFNSECEIGQVLNGILSSFFAGCYASEWQLCGRHELVDFMGGAIASSPELHSRIG